jgi:septum formation protein
MLGVDSISSLATSLRQFTTTLSSGSPQRKAILEELGISFSVITTDCEEIVADSPACTVCENARRKAVAALPRVKDRVILGADTILFSDGRIMGKPGCPDKAQDYLSQISGKTVEAYTGVAALSPTLGRGVVLLELARVRIRHLANQAIEWYVSSGEPITRAGGFGISRLGEIFVQGLEGEYSCVAGLPKRATLLALSDPFLGEQRLAIDDNIRLILGDALVVDRYTFTTVCP